MLHVLDETQEKINECKKSINIDDGTLHLSFRRSLLASFGVDSDIGFKRRSKLALMSVEKILFVWESKFEGDNSIRYAVEKAYKCIENVSDNKGLLREADKLKTKADNLLSGDSENFVAAYVCLACFSALYALVYGYDLSDLAVDDTDLDPDQWDSEYYAAAAYSGGAPWDEFASTKKRHEFWNWYLDVAVPNLF